MTTSVKIKVPGTTRSVEIPSKGSIKAGLNANGNGTGKVRPKTSPAYGPKGPHWPGQKGGEALQAGHAKVARASTVCAMFNKRGSGRDFHPVASQPNVIQSLKSWMTESYLAPMGVNVAVRVNAKGDDYEYCTWLAGEAMPTAAKTLLGIGKAPTKTSPAVVQPIIAAA